MTHIALVVNPPVDDLLSIKWRIIAIDIFRDRLGNIAGVCNAGLRRRAVGARMNVEFVAGDVIGMSLRGLGKQWIDGIRRQSFRCTIGVDGGNYLR